MLQATIENTETLNNFLQAFRPAFKNSPQFRLFQHYVVALILYLGSKNLSGLSTPSPMVEVRAACIDLWPPVTGTVSK